MAVDETGLVVPAAYNTNSDFLNHCIVSFLKRVSSPSGLNLEPMLYQVWQGCLTISAEPAKPASAATTRIHSRPCDVLPAWSCKSAWVQLVHTSWHWSRSAAADLGLRLVCSCQCCACGSKSWQMQRCASARLRQSCCSWLHVSPATCLRVLCLLNLHSRLMLLLMKVSCL